MRFRVIFKIALFLAVSVLVSTAVFGIQTVNANYENPSAYSGTDTKVNVEEINRIRIETERIKTEAVIIQAQINQLRKLEQIEKEIKRIGKEVDRIEKEIALLKIEEDLAVISKKVALLEKEIMPVKISASAKEEASSGVALEKSEEGTAEKKQNSLSAGLLTSAEAILGNIKKAMSFCLNWRLILFFAIFPLIKGLIALRTSEGESDISLKSYFRKQGYFWLASALALIIAVIYAFRYQYHCVAFWIFIILSAVTIIGFYIDQDITERKTKKIGNNLLPSPDQKKLTPPTIFLLIGLLITILFFFIPYFYDPIIVKTLTAEAAFSVDPSSMSNPGLSILIKVTWAVFVFFFLFPVAVMMPLHWYERGKIRRSKRKIPGSPKVSLVFPAYNEEKFIHKTIEQGLKQDYKGQIEVVIIDDGSTDRTFEIVQEVAANNPRVKVYKHDQNLGKPAALNTGFEKATGEISVFCDSDSYLDSDLVSKIIPHFDDPKVGMVAGMIIIDNEINLLTRLQQIEYLYNQEIIRFCQATHKGVLICPGAATAVRTKIAREIPSTERTITEDADFTFEVAKAGWKISQEPEAISRTEAPDNLDDFIDQRKRWLYGVIQTIWIHKWSLFYRDSKTPNLWVWWAWIGYITCPITVFAVLLMPLFYNMLGVNYLVFLAFYSTLVGAIFAFAHWYGIRQYSHSNKTNLSLLLPVYMVYQYLLNVLLFGLVVAFIIRKGVTVRYGGRIIHSV